MLSKLKKLAVNCIIIFLSLLFTLFVTEILIRTTSKSSNSAIGSHHKSFCEFDPILGWKHIANSKAIFETPESKALLTFNSKGIRGPEYSYEKSKDEYRILMLGDSFAEGYNVQFDELFSEVMKKELQARLKSVKSFQAINMATGGWSTDQEFLFFRTEGKKYNPDLVILFFYENDVWFNNQPKYWRGYKPLFAMKNGELILTNVPLPETKESKISTISEDHKTSFPANLKSWFFYHSRLYNLIVTRIKKQHVLYRWAAKLHLSREEFAPKNGGAQKSIAQVPHDFRVWEKTYDDDIRAAWQITEELLESLKKEAASIHADLLVFYVPGREAVYDRVWNDTKEEYGISDTDWEVNQAGIELDKICKKDEINFLNPTELFRKEAKKGVRLYFENDGHWNTQGHQLTANILTDYISSNYIETREKSAENPSA